MRTAQPPKRHGRLRLLARCCVLIAAAVLASPLVAWPWASLILPGLSPHLAILSAVATRSLGLVALLGLPVLVISLIRRRWFCRHACPVGLILEQASRVRPLTRSLLTKRRQVDQAFQQVGQAFQPDASSAPDASAASDAGPTDVRLKSLTYRVPPLGQWIVLVSLGGACLGYPLLAWLDPLAVFNGFAGLWTWPITTARVVAAAGLPCLILLGIALPNLWCRRICPLGATQDLLSLPRQWLGRGPAPSVSSPEMPARRLGSMGRRSVLAMGLGAAWAAITLRQNRSPTGPIRPPGAAEPARFAGLCVRCGNCVRVCPTGILRPDLGRHGVAAFLAPVVWFEQNYCLADCNRCTQVCPTGAIARLSLEEKRAAPLGRPKVDLSRCRPPDHSECSACMNVCPYEAIRIVSPEDEYQSFPQVDLSKCPGCGACQVACPTTPKAMVIEPPD